MKKVDSLLGFAAKAGQLIVGSAAVETAIKRSQVSLVICAQDLAPRTINNFHNWCQQNKINYYSYGKIDELGQIIGKPGRGVLGVTSKQFAAAIIRCLSNGGE